MLLMFKLHLVDKNQDVRLWMSGAKGNYKPNQIQTSPISCLNAAAGSVSFVLHIHMITLPKDKYITDSTQ